MYSIGQFSMICNLNKKTLRYYDEIDLFKPAKIDETNQYRYYDESQIEVIREILRLKAIGINLDQIKGIISEKGSGHSIEQMNRVYIQRLDAIENLLKQLKEQKALIHDYLNLDAQKNEESLNYSIEKGFFIESGNVFYNSIQASQEDLNTVIGTFYESGNGLKLTSSHIFRRSLDEHLTNYDEIFAYTSENVNNTNVRAQSQALCLRLICDGIKNREKSYKQLFDYINSNGYVIGYIYEKYRMINGHMSVEIIASTL